MRKSARSLINLASMAPGITGAARAHDITRQLIYQWRQQLKRNTSLKGHNSFGNIFFPLVASAVNFDPIKTELCVEARLTNGRGFRVLPALCPNKLFVMIRVLRPHDWSRLWPPCLNSLRRQGHEKAGLWSDDVCAGYLAPKSASGPIFAYRDQHGETMKPLIWEFQEFCLYYKVSEDGRLV